MITEIFIRLNADDDAMVGAEGWGEYDAAASIDQCCDAIIATLRPVYPQATMTITPEVSLYDTKIVINADDDDLNEDEEAAYIRDVIGDVWQRWNWLVKA